MVRELLRERVACGLVLGCCLTAGVALQANWLYLKRGASYEKHVIERYVIVAPLTGLAGLGLWLGYVGILRRRCPSVALEAFARLEAWSMTPLVLTLHAFWQPPLTRRTWYGIVFLVALSKAALYRNEVLAWASPNMRAWLREPGSCISEGRQGSGAIRLTR